MSNALTLRQRLLNTFAHKRIDRLVFSPRLYYWYLGNKLYLRPKKMKQRFQRKIPPQFLGKSQLKIYDYLEASPRYTLESLYIPLIWPRIKIKKGFYIAIKRGPRYGDITTYYKTPLGILRKVKSGGHIIEWPIKKIKDIKIMRYILKNTKFHFLYFMYKLAELKLRDRGVPCTYFLHSPYMRLIIDYMGFSNTIISLRRHKSEIENFMKFIENWDNHMFDVLARSPLKIINFGENIDANLSPPPYFEKYLIPYYEKRVKQLHRAGKYCHIHMDGSLKDLLPYLSELPFDGLEALTPKPQGDVSMEELQESIGNKILLDGIPSVLFLPQYSLKYVKNFTKKLLDMFSPNLIVGISDEFPPNGQIAKIEVISRIVKEYSPF
ncbi:MAG: uroporphyrinogen decarboxylase family protein [Promethearchaeota archaeon]